MKQKREKKKKKHVFRKIIGTLLLVLLAFCAVGAVYRLIKIPAYKTELAGSYGRTLEVFGSKMNVVEMGEGDETIVLLPGSGDTSPYYCFRHFAEILTKEFRVVIVEPFGYGLSDITERDRTAPNIAEEIHECVKQLGLDHYVIGGHSLAGIWLLEYANDYPDEVDAVLALDNSYPTQNSEIGGMGIALALNSVIGALNKGGLLSGIGFFDDTLCIGSEECRNTEELNRVFKMQVIGAVNRNVMDELRYFKDNEECLATLSYPESVPVFSAICSANVEGTMDDSGASKWMAARFRIAKCPDSVIKVYDGTHYIYQQQGEGIYADFSEFLKNVL